MCIGFPGKILSIDEANQALIDIGGIKREVSLDIMDEPVAVGDYVITHAGFAIHKVDEAQAIESLELLKEILEKEPGLLEQEP
jgi:hydrogenase expression/formation protein HypC